MSVELAELESVDEVGRAAVLLQPLRLEILRRARRPSSAAEIAAELGLPRQRVNYHVRALARARFLRSAGRRRRRNLYEQRYVATARAYALSPELLGPLAAEPEQVEDRLGAAFQLLLALRLQRDLSHVMRQAAVQQRRVATLSFEADVRFESSEQRERFARALQDAVARVVAEHTSPMQRSGGEAGDGRPYRLVLACHPAPAPEDGAGAGDEAVASPRAPRGRDPVPAPADPLTDP